MFSSNVVQTNSPPPPLLVWVLVFDRLIILQQTERKQSKLPLNKECLIEMYETIYIKLSDHS